MSTIIFVFYWRIFILNRTFYNEILLFYYQKPQIDFLKRFLNRNVYNIFALYITLQHYSVSSLHFIFLFIIFLNKKKQPWKTQSCLNTFTLLYLLKRLNTILPFLIFLFSPFSFSNLLVPISVTLKNRFTTNKAIGKNR